MKRLFIFMVCLSFARQHRPSAGRQLDIFVISLWVIIAPQLWPARGNFAAGGAAPGTGGKGGNTGRRLDSFGKFRLAGEGGAAGGGKCGKTSENPPQSAGLTRC
ncbi:hypothetical protein K3553_04920 [Leisingera aquaemixtae]|uniref:hypothetical protein n=1 Tax=Leisingera aquaemixtae TaxID=1396826 RepID=UPI0021A6F65D|nr:hypothetical protein [Leisingera aquaemixtae]UWQ25807.1 hypothetical protein K3553_04920 [Leisingera aquaemixtae]